MSEQNTPQVREINISQEMRTSFLDYAMSVIVSRALPGRSRRFKTGS